MWKSRTADSMLLEKQPQRQATSPKCAASWPGMIHPDVGPPALGPGWIASVRGDPGFLSHPEEGPDSLERESSSSGDLREGGVASTLRANTSSACSYSTPPTPSLQGSVPASTKAQPMSGRRARLEFKPRSQAG